MDSVDAIAAILGKYDVDVVTGVFIHKSGWRKGQPTRGINPANGYETVYCAGKNHLKHRIVWLLVHGVWPDGPLDHKDIDKTNNAIGNLRKATPSQNLYNKTVSAKSSTGVKGVRRTVYGTFQASIRTAIGRLHLGSFKNIEDAALAYRNAALVHHGEFCRFEGASK